MKKRLLMFVTLTLIGLMTGCQNMTKITEEMNGTTISVKKGTAVTLTLTGNPTTGFNWELIEVDSSILSPDGEPDYNSDSALIGSGGVYTFKFTAVQAGNTNLKLIYYRSFEKDVPPADTFEVNIEVK